MCLMLTIRSEQADVLREAGKVKLVERVAHHLRANHPEDVARIDEDELRQGVKIRLERGRGYGITSESSLAGFACLTYTVAERFDEHRAVKRVLSDPDLPANLRVDALLSELSDEDWAEASRLG